MKKRHYLLHAIALAIVCTHPALADDASPVAPVANSSAPSLAASALATPDALRLSMEPDDVLRRLKLGNAAFSSGNARHPAQDLGRLRETSAGQKPVATVLSCSDSRVPIELLFDRGVGDLFGVRVAGNVADTDELGSLEYGVDHLGTPVLVVLGHTRCGAVTAVATGAEVHGHIPALVDNIRPAVERAKSKAPAADPGEWVEPAIVENVYESMADIIGKSAAIRARLKDGRARMVGAVYRIDDGTVDWLGEHPDQKELVAAADAAPASHEGAPHVEAHEPASSSGAASPEAHEVAELPRGPAPNMAFAFAITAAVGCLAGALSSRLSSRG